MVSIAPISGKNYAAEFDMDARCVEIKYYGNLDREAPEAVYGWMEENLPKVEAAGMTIMGVVFDFQQVEQFEADNLAAAQEESLSLRRQQREIISDLPIALVVKTIFQQTMVETTLMLNRQAKNPRIKIVNTIDEAHQHISTWRAAEST
jgi:hypothetical protein